MKFIQIILLINIFINQNTYENQNIQINEKVKPIVLNIFENKLNLYNFEIGFYLYIYEYKFEFILISLTDFFNFNIDIMLKNDHFIYINDTKTNWSLQNEIQFFYIKGEIINNKVNISLIINNKNEIYEFIYNKNLKEFTFNMITPIIGSNKLLLDFKFKGSILYLGSYLNSESNKFNNLKDANSKILIFHNFGNHIYNQRYLENNLNNGFMGSINNNNKNFGINIYSRNSTFTYKNFAIFRTSNSAINLSTDFIKYISNFEKKIYTVYLALEIIPNKTFYQNFDSINFYFYKRENLKFFNNIKYTKKDQHEFKIYSSNNEEYKGVSNNTTIFESIILKFFNISNNKYSITYEYNTNKNKTEEYNNFKIIKEELFFFNSHDKHKVGYIDEIKVVKMLNFKINILELGLIIGSNFYTKNNKLYTKQNKELFLLSCNSKSKVYKSRWNNSENMCLNSLDYTEYDIIDCLEVKNGICLKCINNRILKNNSCNTFNIFSGINNFKTYFGNTNFLKKHEFNKILDNKYKIYNIFCKFNVNENTIFNIKINNINVKKNFIINEHKINKNFNFRIIAINKLKIIIESNNESKFNYNCELENINRNSLDRMKFKKQEFLYYYKYFFKDLYNYESIIDINKFPSNYYMNDKKIVLKCHNSCINCNNFNNCLKCQDNYQLIQGVCIYINKNLKLLNYMVYNNDKNLKIKYSNSKNCYKGCSNCNSPLFNECLGCLIGFIYYPETNQCVKSSNCKQNYSLFNINNKNICLLNCKEYDSNKKCISCNNLLNLYIDDNICVLCNNDNSYYKDKNNLDFNKKPICKKCSNNCKTCSGNEDRCTSCHSNKFIISDKFTCFDNCPIGYYKNNSICLKCNSNCINCLNANTCLKCIEGKFIKKNICVDGCGKNYFLKNNTCTKCSNNCLNCNNSLSCLKCMPGFYKNNKNKCVVCNQINQFINIKGICSKCSKNCKKCNKYENNCLSCNKGFKMKKMNNLSFCLKKCNYNNYFNLNNNKCLSCKNCNTCYSNNKLNCYNCPICKNKCELNVYYDNYGIHIKGNIMDGITFNKNYKLMDLQTNNIIENNSIKLWFNNIKATNFNLNLTNDIIKESKNCYNISKKKYFLNKMKTDCFIKSFKLYNLKNLINLQLSSNIIFIEKPNFNFYIKNTSRIVSYKIKKINYIDNISYILIELYPNYYKNDYEITMNLNKSSMNVHSPCNLINISKKFKNNFFKKIEVFKPDYMLSKENIKFFYEDNLLKNINKISNSYQNILKNSSLIWILINIYKSGNLLPLWSIIQLVYFLELILLLPINLGYNVNTFIKYLKLDLDNEINIEFIINIKNNVVKKIYKDLYNINPKLSDVSWINVLNFQLDIIFIIFLYLFQFILLIIKKIMLKVNPNIKINNFKILNKLILNTKIIRFKLIETFKVIIMSIWVVYLSQIYKLQLNFDNVKIYMIVFFYYIILCHYYWDLLSCLMYIRFSKKNKIYYNNIIFTSNTYSLNIVYQIINSIRELLFVIVIFILKNIQIHSFIFLIIQIIFVIYTFLLNKKNNYFSIQKIKIEEIINIIWILSWILNYNFQYEQFQILFIVFYIILFSLNLILLSASIINYFFEKINIKLKQIKILAINKVRNK